MYVSCYPKFTFFPTWQIQSKKQLNHENFQVVEYL